MPRLKALDDAAAQSGIHRRTLQRWMKEGQLTAYRIAGDRRRFIDLEELDKLREPVALARPRKRSRKA